MGRIQNVKINAIYNLLSNVVTMLLSFVTRTLFIYTLGVKYLGLNGLFTSILGVLSLADLGISTAITYSLYQPLSDDNQNKIGQIIALFGKMYKIIGIIIFALGICLVPFLKYLVNFPEGININYYVIYLLFLINSVSTYLFFSYKNTVLYANQQSYLTVKYEIFYSIITMISQIIVLLIFENYYIYLLIPIFITVFKNYRVSKIAEKFFPIIKTKKFDPLDSNDKKEIIKNVYSISMIKISGIIYSSSDNLVISTFINTSIVGYYSNYIMILNIIKSLVGSIFNSMVASVGNLNASESAEYKYLTFKRLNFINFVIYGFCFICLNQLLNPFITVWIGEKYIFKNITVLLICLTFLIPGMNNIINIYKDGCGLFWETRFRTLLTAIVNITISIILVKKLGINGVLLGTILAYCLTIYIVDPIIVYKKVFVIPVIKYYSKLAQYFLCIVALNCFIGLLISKIVMSNIIDLLIKLLMIIVTYFMIISIIFYKSEEYKYFLVLFKKILRKEK